MSASVSTIETHNHILRSLPSDEMASLEPHLERVDMPRGDILYDADDPISRIYFPDTAMVSVVASTYSGQTAESGVVGWEGVAGVEALIGTGSSLNRHIVQLGGTGHRADTRLVVNEFEKVGELHRQVLEFVRGMMLQMSQTALCNRMHLAEKRFAKWLLMCADRAFVEDLPITQEFAALMLGSNRVSVVQAAKALEDQKLIRHSRGRITITDRKGLEGFACECYERIRREFARLTR
jgi:CRP-like cAMP-binding protein